MPLRITHAFQPPWQLLLVHYWALDGSIPKRLVLLHDLQNTHTKGIHVRTQTGRVFGERLLQEPSRGSRPLLQQRSLQNPVHYTQNSSRSQNLGPVVRAKENVVALQAAMHQFVILLEIPEPERSWGQDHNYYKTNNPRECHLLRIHRKRTDLLRECTRVLPPFIMTHISHNREYIHFDSDVNTISCAAMYRGVRPSIKYIRS